MENQEGKTEAPQASEPEAQPMVVQAGELKVPLKKNDMAVLVVLDTGAGGVTTIYDVQNCGLTPLCKGLLHGALDVYHAIEAGKYAAYFVREELTKDPDNTKRFHVPGMGAFGKKK